MKQLRLLVIMLIIISSATLSARNEKPFRMIDINVWSGSDYQGLLEFTSWETPSQAEKRYQILLANLKEANPDVIFIQESTPVDRYTRRLAKDLNMDQIHQVCIAGIKIFGIGPPLGFKEGNAILARKGLELTKLDDWKLSGGPGIYGDNISFHYDETVSALLGRISIDGKPVYLICTHLYAGPRDETALEDSLKAMLDNGEVTRYRYEILYKRWQKGIDRREREMGILLDNIRKLPKDVPMILGGDLNAPPQTSVVYKFIRNGRFVNLPLEPNPEAVTWDAIGNNLTEKSQRYTDARNILKDEWYKFNAIAAKLPRRLDYIFLNDKFAGTDSIRSKIILDKPVNGIFASDHYGIQVDLDIAASLDGVPLLYGPPEIHKMSQSFLPVIYPYSSGFGYGATAYLLSAFKRNESFELTLTNQFHAGFQAPPTQEIRQRL
jgi:endonuclease/exonuclease/phosphatase family metal-dependent hydrolase